MLRDPAIVISGGTGFLGRYLVDAFLGAGYRVGVLCRASSPREVLDGQEVTFFEADIESATACRLALASARESLGDFQMVHNAALVSYRECDREALRRTNVDGVRNVWAACAEVGVRRGVHVSSVVAVGTSPAGQRIDEEHPFDGHALGVEYVDTKWAGEQIALGDHGSMEV
ncbi:MAG TPA: SDR family NAD(P)-dependent oxidoreductase, partial [Planctomycetota bacterium]|nr:SDR family NAD(P)-dependent oxidoreductase [Planctomycetota bacterium]